MDAKLRFIGEIEVVAEAGVDLGEVQNESAGLLRDKLAADCSGNDGI